MKLKKSTVAVIGTIVILVALVAVLVLVYRGQLGDQPSDGSLSITAGETQLKKYTFDEIRAFPSVDIDKLITSSKEDDEQGVFTGVPLEILLDDADPGWREKYSEFILNSSDGFKVGIFKSDIDEGDNVLLVYQKDGELLAGKDQGGKGPLRIVIVADPFGNRSAYWLTSIEVK